MKAGQKSKRNGIEDILCPFTDIVITQGTGINGNTYSHDGTRACDIRGINVGERYPYYAPFKCKAVHVIPSYGQTVWQSLEKVRFADGTVDYCTFLTVHDDTINFGVGLVVEQGGQIGNMGTAGNATGVHCHIEFAKGLQGLVQNKYGIWGLSNSVELEEACFMDNTNIIHGVAKWVYLKNVPVEETKKIKEELESIKSQNKDLMQQLAIYEEQNNILRKENENNIKEISKLNKDLEKAKQVQEYEELFNLGKLYLCIKKSN